MTSFQAPLKIIFVERKKAPLGVPAWPFLALSFFIMGLGALLAKLYFIHLLPPCGFHTLTGHPCPTCGVCRMSFFFLEGNFKESFLIQPFFFLVLTFFAIWITAGFIAFLFGKLMFLELCPFWQKYFWVPLVVLFLLNWAYIFDKGI
jgi:hypothetical protein